MMHTVTIKESWTIKVNIISPILCLDYQLTKIAVKLVEVVVIVITISTTLRIYKRPGIVLLVLEGVPCFFFD
jgi:hypothetical protein